MYNLLWEGVVMAVLQGCCLHYFYHGFLEPRFRIRGSGCVVIIFWTACKTAIDFGFQTVENSILKIGKMAVLYVLLLFLALVFFKGKKKIAVFLSVEFLAVNDIILMLVYTLQQTGGYLFLLWDWCIGQGYLPGGEAAVTAARRSIIAMKLIACVVFVVLLYMSLRKVVRSYREKEYSIRKEELVFLILPGSAAVCICELLNIIMFTLKDNVPDTLYDKYPILLLLVPAILLLLLLSTIYTVTVFQDMIRLGRERSSRIRMEQQITGLQEHMEELGQIHSGIRGIRHDMKNILSVIAGLTAGGGETEDGALSSYLAELERTMDKLELRFQTGNTVADALLHMKYHEAVRAVPDLGMDAEALVFPASLRIQGYDIGIILGNALDNAIEACRKLKEREPAADAYLRLASFQRGSMFFLEIENSFDGTLLQSPQAEFPATDKADKEAHGMGLANIKHAAEKYHGAVEWMVNGRVFTLSVMMKNEVQGGQSDGSKRNWKQL